MSRTAFTLAVALAVAGIASAGAACADPQVGNGNVDQQGTGTSGNNGVGSVLVQTVNGVTTVIVDGKTLTGDDAQPYIDAAHERSQRIRSNIDRWGS